MTTDGVEQDFLAWRERREPELLARVFDRSGAELLRVALHLSRDLSAAEDLVQETYVTAIERAGRFRTGERLLPWLLGILVVHDRQRRRRAARSERERDRRPSIVEEPSAAARVVAAELTQEVESAIDGLGGEQRDVLRMRLFDGLRPAEIASRLGRAPGTVRMQLHRGLEALRSRLPQGVTPAAAWVVSEQGAPTSEAVVGNALRERVLAAASRRGARATTAERSQWVAAEPLRLLVGLGVVSVLALVSWMTVSLLEGDPVPAPERVATALVDVGASSRQPENSQLEREGALRVEAGVRVFVRWKSDGRPASGVRVSCRPIDGLALSERGLEASTEAAGQVEFDVAGGGPWLVRIERTGQERIVTAESRRTLEFALDEGVRLAGRVVGPRGERLREPARIRIRSRGVGGVSNFNSDYRVVDEFWTESDGSFALEGIHPNQLFHAESTSAQFGVASSLPQSLAQSSDEVVLALTERHLPVLVKVIDQHGLPLPGVELVAAETVGWNGSVHGQLIRGPRALEEATADADGIAEFSLSPCQWNIYPRDRMRFTGVIGVWVDPFRSSERALVLRVETNDVTEREIRILDLEGQPQVNVAVLCEDIEYRTNENGLVRLAVDRRWQPDVEVFGLDLDGEEIFTAGSATHEVRLPRDGVWRFEGQLVDEQRRPVGGGSLRISPFYESRLEAGLGNDGAFVCLVPISEWEEPDLPDWTWLGFEWRAADDRVWVGVDRIETGVDGGILAFVPTRCDSVLRGRILSPAGLELTLWVGSEEVAIDDDGVFALEGLSAGRFDCELRSSSGVEFGSRRVEVDGIDDVDLGTWEIGPVHRLTIEMEADSRWRGLDPGVTVGGAFLLVPPGETRTLLLPATPHRAVWDHRVNSYVWRVDELDLSSGDQVLRLRDPGLARPDLVLGAPDQDRRTLVRIGLFGAEPDRSLPSASDNDHIRGCPVPRGQHRIRVLHESGAKKTGTLIVPIDCYEGQRLEVLWDPPR